MAFPASFIDELISKNDLEELVSEYLSLKGSGQSRFGLCPFHKENTASFSVSPDKQLYYCFGCGKGGGVINFVMEIENLDYPEAIRFLAERSGMEVPEDGDYQSDYKLQRRLYEVCKAAARFYHDKLMSEEGGEALAYLLKRGMSRGTVRRFGLGFSPDSWDALIKHLAGLGYEKSELLLAGLVVKNKSSTGVYDRFRNRIMFPIIDLRGNVIGFGGRVMDDSMPKYLNSPDSKIFNKSKNLFALNIAKNSKSGKIILTEGYMDAIALHSAGFDYAVASLGTALTAEHAKLLLRYEEVIIAYDDDEAGQKAAQRAISTLGRLGINVRLIRMTGAKDPDEYIKKFGKNAFARLLDRSETHVEYRFNDLERKYDLSRTEEKLSFFNEAIELISSLSSAVEREVYILKVSETMNISPDSLKIEVNKSLKKRLKKEKQKTNPKYTAPEVFIKPKDKAIEYSNPKSARAEEGIIRLASHDCSLLRYCEGLEAEDFSAPVLGKAYGLIRARHEAGLSTLIAGLEGEMTREEMSHLSDIAQTRILEQNKEQSMADFVETIKSESGKDDETDLPLLTMWDKKKKDGARRDNNE